MRSLNLAARFAAPLLLLLTLSACQDPTGVGLGLIDDDASQPNAQSVFATSASLQPAETTTAGFASSGAPVQSRVLIGSVVDPLYGDASARAYLDANLPGAGRPENFQDSTITAVALQLRFDTYISVDSDTSFYVYGDPAAELPVEIREITSGWAPTDLAVNATLPVGDAVLATGRILPTDTTVTINLDPAWVSANADKIRSTEFLTEFEGFEVRVPDATVSGGIRGFNVSLSDMLVATSQDTLEFPINEVLTSLNQEDAAPSTDLLAIRAGRASALAFEFDFAPIGVSALARADVRLPLDRSQAGGAAFVRPLARQALLTGIPSNSEQVQLSVLSIGSEGDVTSQGAAGFTAAIQDVLIGTQSYDRYDVTLQSNPVSLDVLPVIVAPPADQPGPRFTLTLVGQPVQ
ncbi:MAG: hypothetical protein AAF170_02365 [Bacteroidota bacterium]